MHKVTPTLLLVLLGVGCGCIGTSPVYADVQVDLGEQPPAATPESLLSQRSSAPVVLERPAFPESRFNPNEVERNPFWPIAWRPSKNPAPQVPDPVRFTLPVGTLKVSSTMTGPGALAVINGKTYGIGERFYLEVEQKYVKVSVSAVIDGAVIVKIGGKPYRLSMRRSGDALEQPLVFEAVDLADGEVPRALPVDLPQVSGWVDTTTRQEPLTPVAELADADSAPLPYLERKGGLLSELYSSRATLPEALPAPENEGDAEAPAPEAVEPPAESPPAAALALP